MELITGFFLPSLANSLERTLTETLKFKHLDRVFRLVWNVLILWNSKSTWFCVCENMRTYDAKPNLTRCFNSPFLLFNLTQMK